LALLPFLRRSVPIQDELPAAFCVFHKTKIAAFGALVNWAGVKLPDPLPKILRQFRPHRRGPWFGVILKHGTNHADQVVGDLVNVVFDFARSLGHRRVLSIGTIERDNRMIQPQTTGDYFGYVSHTGRRFELGDKFCAVLSIGTALPKRRQHK
jgi:hypothetical protein